MRDKQNHKTVNHKVVVVLFQNEALMEVLNNAKLTSFNGDMPITAA